MNNKICLKISIALDLPITQIGFLAKRSLPTTPMYFDLKDMLESLNHTDNTAGAQSFFYCDGFGVQLKVSDKVHSC